MELSDLALENAIARIETMEGEIARDAWVYGRAVERIAKNLVRLALGAPPCLQCANTGYDWKAKQCFWCQGRGRRL